VRVLCIAGGFDLSLGLLGEGKTEESKGVAIGGLALDESLNKGMPFFDHRACFVSRDIHAVEVRVTVVMLDLVDLELKLSPGIGFRLVVAVG